MVFLANWGLGRARFLHALEHVSSRTLSRYLLTLPPKESTSWEGSVIFFLSSWVSGLWSRLLPPEGPAPPTWSLLFPFPGRTPVLCYQLPERLESLLRVYRYFWTLKEGSGILRTTGSASIFGISPSLALHDMSISSSSSPMRTSPCSFLEPMGGEENPTGSSPPNLHKRAGP